MKVFVTGGSGLLGSALSPELVENNESKPLIIEGGLYVDDRGDIAFVNDSHFEGVKQFHIVSNHDADFEGAWHGRHHGAKCVIVVHGAAIVAAAAVDTAALA